MGCGILVDGFEWNCKTGVNHLVTVFVHSADNIGWSIDSDRALLMKSIQRIGGRVTSFFPCADIVHNVWWNQLAILNFQNIWLRRKRQHVLATASNFINLDDPKYVLRKEFETVNKFTDAWIAPSSKQKDIFDRHGIKSFYHPFYIDIQSFKPMGRNSELYKSVSIPEDIIKDKIVIGSFQRDSLGTDLTKPKWQKGPELLISLLRDLPKDRFLLLLAGPRRHYVINECKRFGIPYYYLGKETEKDDISFNALPITLMPRLYAATDIYLITSRSEGGPKAAMEAAATKTFVMTTDVGLVNDFIAPEFVFCSDQGFKEKLAAMVEGTEDFGKVRDLYSENQYENFQKKLSYSRMDKSLLDIYSEIIGDDLKMPLKQ
jgi:glycosyltransferase involved in cell wall biosynthesis